MEEKNTVRIIGGKYGKRKLNAFRADHIRPTTDQIKESLFNKIQWIVEKASVLDLFSGTGSLALEALSRGASEAVCVDSHPLSIQIIDKNKKTLGIDDQLKVLKSDVFSFLKNNKTSFDLIFVDPPFTKKIAHKSLMALSRSRAIKPHTEIFIESSIQETVEKKYSRFYEKSKRKYGNRFLSHYVFKDLSL